MNDGTTNFAKPVSCAHKLFMKSITRCKLVRVSLQAHNMTAQLQTKDQLLGLFTDISL